jgi:hypothetical protein
VRTLSVVELTHVEAASNTSTVILRVVGGDEKGSLKSEKVNYDREYQGPGPEKDSSGKGSIYKRQIRSLVREDKKTVSCKQ